MGRKKENFSNILEKELGYREISREKFYRILEKKKRNRLSSEEFLKLLDIIKKQ